METQQKKPTVAQQVVGMMADAGIKHVYAITGDSLNEITEAIHDDGRMKFIHMRHEESGAFAASAEAQLTGKLACCAGSSGPGHVHLINGLYDAQRSGAPVLAIASTCTSQMFGTGYFQETNPTLLFSNCNVYNETALTTQQVPRMLQGAMQAAISEGGVGVFGLPADLTGQTAQAQQNATRPLYTQRVPLPSEDEISRTAEILNKANKVVIFAGHGAKDAKDELLALSAKLNAPVSTTYKSQLELTGDCPNYVGHLAYLGMWSAVKALQEADAILLIGMNFPYPSFFPVGTPTIQVDIRAERLGLHSNLAVGIRSDSKEFLSRLLPEITQKKDRTFLDSALKDFSSIKNKMAEPVAHPGSKGKIRPEYMMATLDRLASDDCVVTVDTGMNNVWTSHYLTPGKGRRMVGSFQHGSMANALPMAIGAYQACPDKQIIAICGDGGLTMLMGELLTVIQYNMPVKILVADNRSLAFVQWEMEAAGIKPWETNLTNPDFGEMARAIGFQAETVSDPAELENAMKRWLSAEGPALLSVTTDADAASFTFSKELMDGAKPGNVVSNFLPLGSL